MNARANRRRKVRARKRMGRWASDPLRLLLRLAKRNVTFHVNARCDGMPRVVPPPDGLSYLFGSGVIYTAPSDPTSPTVTIGGEPVDVREVVIYPGRNRACENGVYQAAAGTWGESE